MFPNLPLPSLPLMFPPPPLPLPFPPRLLPPLPFPPLLALPHLGHVHCVEVRHAPPRLRTGRTGPVGAGSGTHHPEPGGGAGWWDPIQALIMKRWCPNGMSPEGGSREGNTNNTIAPRLSVSIVPQVHISSALFVAPKLLTPPLPPTLDPLCHPPQHVGQALVREAWQLLQTRRAEDPLRAPGQAGCAEAG